MKISLIYNISHSLFDELDTINIHNFNYFICFEYKFQFYLFFLGERANIVKRGDNLQPEGDFQKRPDQTWAPGERANIVKRGEIGRAAWRDRV